MNTEPVMVPVDEQALIARVKRESQLVLGARYLVSGAKAVLARFHEKNRQRRDNDEAPILYQFAYWLWGVDPSKAEIDDNYFNDNVWLACYYVGMSLLTVAAIAFLPVRVAYVIVDKIVLRPLGWCFRKVWYGDEK